MSTPSLTNAEILRLRQRRLDARRRLTNGNVKCNPPNVRCGDRCIPPSWSCRRNGQGIDSHAKAARFDPVKGTASLIKGSRDLTKGALSLNVERFNRGKNAISRGLTKLNPDKDLKRKQEFRQRIDDWLIPITSVGLLAMGVAAGHNALKFGNVGGYRNGLGAQLDNAALRAVNGFWDRVPGVAQRRASQQALTASGFSTLGRAGRATQLRASQFSRPSRESNFLAGTRRQAALGNRRFSEIDNLAKRNGLPFEAWQTQRAKAQIGLTRAGKSVYADDAANDYLASRFPALRARKGAPLTKDEVISGVTKELVTTRSAITTAMAERGLKITSPADQDRFWNDFAPSVERQFRGLNAQQKAKAMSSSRSLYRDVLKNEPESLAKRMWNESRDFFDEYFKDASERVSRPPSASDSFAKPASIAVARTVAGGRGVINASHASWINRAYYNKTVSSRARAIYASDRSILETARAVTGSLLSDPKEALRILQTGSYGSRNFAPVPSLERRTTRGRRGDAADRLDARRTTGGPRGKKCGGSYIPANFKCHNGREESKAPERGTALKTAGKIALGAGLTAGALLGAKKGAGLALRAKGPVGNAARNIQSRGRQSVAKYGAGLSNRGVERLSSKQVKEALDKLPAQWQPKARNLVGRAKSWTAEMGLRARGAELVYVDDKMNYSTWKYEGRLTSLSSVGDDILTFNTDRKKDIGGFSTYEMNFQINNQYDAGSKNASANSMKIYKANSSIFKNHLENLPENAFIKVKAYAADGKGSKRSSVYQKWGFRPVEGVRGNDLWALKNEGKFTKIPDSQMDRIRDLIIGRRDAAPEDGDTLKGLGLEL